MRSRGGDFCKDGPIFDFPSYEVVFSTLGGNLRGWHMCKLHANFPGSKSIAALGEKTSVHSSLKGIYYEALSPQAVAKMAPFLESCLSDRAKKWDHMAKSGEVTINHIHNRMTVFVNTLGEISEGEWSLAGKQTIRPGD